MRFLILKILVKVKFEAQLSVLVQLLRTSDPDVAPRVANGMLLRELQALLEFGTRESFYVHFTSLGRRVTCIHVCLVQTRGHTTGAALFDLLRKPVFVCNSLRRRTSPALRLNAALRALSLTTHVFPSIGLLM